MTKVLIPQGFVTEGARMVEALVELLATRKATENLSAQQRSLLAQHLIAVLEQNKTMNLTSIKDRNEGVLLHIEDSLLGLTEVECAPEGKLADMGSGGGYPGIPLALITGRTTALIEATQKKAAFLTHCIHDLRLEAQITAYPERIEAFASAHFAEFLVVTARALTALCSLVELASPLLAPGGQLIAYKGSPSPQEINEGKKAADLVGMTLTSNREAVLSDGITKRHILVYTKTHESSVRLPRRNGLAQKSPLQ